VVFDEKGLGHLGVNYLDLLYIDDQIKNVSAYFRALLRLDIETKCFTIN